MMAMLADIALYLHFLWILFILVGFVVVIIGGIAKWSFIRNPWFRWIHLGMMMTVVLLTLFDIECPLTTLENFLRAQNGAEGYESTFMAYWVSQIIYHDFPPWVFALSYVAIALAIIALFIIFPPRKFKTFRK